MLQITNIHIWYNEKLHREFKSALAPNFVAKVRSSIRGKITPSALRISAIRNLLFVHYIKYTKQYKSIYAIYRNEINYEPIGVILTPLRNIRIKYFRHHIIKSLTHYIYIRI